MTDEERAGPLFSNVTLLFNASLNDEEDVAGSDTVLLAAAGLGLYALSLLTIVGNAMVLHAIRTEKSLQTVRRYMNSYI